MKTTLTALAVTAMMYNQPGAKEPVPYASWGACVHKLEWFFHWEYVQSMHTYCLGSDGSMKHAREFSTLNDQKPLPPNTPSRNEPEPVEIAPQILQHNI